jgi:hypothetical protein
MVIPGGFAIIKPDTIPVLIKTIMVPPIIYFAQMDKNGLVWVTPPYDQRDVNSDHVYVIDPINDVITKSIKLPEQLRTPSCMVITDNKIYLRGDRNGFNVGIGSIDRLTYDIELLAELDTSGFANFPGLEIMNGNIISFCETNGRNPGKIVLFNPTTKATVTRIIGTYYRYTYDTSYIYLTVETNENPMKLLKLDPSTLNVVDEAVLGGDELYITSNDKDIFVGSFANRYIKVIDKTNLGILKTIDLSAHTDIYFNRSFDFITNDILMINDNSFYDFKNDRLLKKLFPIDYPQTMNLTLAEGQSLN